MFVPYCEVFLIRLLQSSEGILLVSPGDQYYIYEFLHQPSHEECVAMSEASPSTLFGRYTGVYYNNYERFLSELFSDCELWSWRLFFLVLQCCHLVTVIYMFIYFFQTFSASASR